MEKLIMMSLTINLKGRSSSQNYSKLLKKSRNKEAEFYKSITPRLKLSNNSKYLTNLKQDQKELKVREEYFTIKIIEDKFEKFNINVNKCYFKKVNQIKIAFLLHLHSKLIIQLSKLMILLILSKVQLKIFIMVKKKRKYQIQ